MLILVHKLLRRMNHTQPHVAFAMGHAIVRATTASAETDCHRVRLHAISGQVCGKGRVHHSVARIICGCNTPIPALNTVTYMAQRQVHFAVQGWGKSWVNFPECGPENLTALPVPDVYHVEHDPSERFPLDSESDE
jgi:hypothetical protein